jgi:hypothetical protein
VTDAEAITVERSGHVLLMGSIGPTKVTDDAILRVVLADKVNGARSIVRDSASRARPFGSSSRTGPPMTSSGM